MISPESTGESLPYGLTVLADGIDPVLDIVAVHGLNGHREKTWVVNSVHWLRDFLPLDIPNARIYSWGYDANVHSTSPINAQCLYDYSTTLISDLNRERKRTKTSTRPIIFVAHSLGGIVVKNALILSENTREGSLEEHRSIKLSTYGVLFMGTPPQGNSGAHLGELMLNVASIFVAFNDRVLRHHEQDSEWLEQQLGQFAPISRDFAIKFACEIYPTPIASGETRMIVPRHLTAGTADADIILIPADHLNMVKFASREDGGYKKVSEYLWLLAKEAPDAISARWAEQKKTKKVQANVKQDFSVPFSLFGVPKVKKFVGRKEELIMIKEAFEGDGTQRKIVILHGLGGVGKTQLAVEFLYAHRDIYSAIFWLNGRNEDTLKQSFAGMANRLYMQYPSSTLLKTATESQDANETIAAIKQWLSKKENNKWFLVFDNVDNPRLPETSDSQAYDIRSYFPEAHHGLILITTRSSRLNIGKVISVKKLADIQESIIILATTSGRKDLDQDPYAINLIEELDGLPLALATAGAYLSQVEISLKDYLYHYRTSWLRLQQTTPDLLFYDDRTLYTTWNLSLQHIQKQNKSAEKLLRLWAYFDNQDLWFHLLAAGRENGPEWFTTITKDELSFTKIVELLCDHALIEPVNNLGGYSMHTCVHAWAVHVLNAEKEISMARLALNCVGLAVPTHDAPEYWAIGRRLLLHANKCLKSIHQGIDVQFLNDQNICHAIHNLGVLYVDQGKMQEAEAIYLLALEGYEKVWGPENTQTLDTVNNLGVLYKNQGKIQEAEAMYRRALEGYEKAWGPEHPSTLDTVNNLGILYKIQGKMQEAEAMYWRALEGKEKAWGSENTRTLDTVNNLGVLYKNQGKIQEAEAMYRRALEGYEKAWGPEHPSTLDTINNLGILYKNQGRIQEAEAMYRRALEGYEKVWGPEHPSTLDTVNNLGILYEIQGKIREAEVMYSRALEGYEKAWGADHTRTLDTVNNMGNLYSNQGKMQEAETMYWRALKGKEEALGPEHLTTLDTVNNLGILYSNQGKMQEAEALYRRALEGKKKALGPEHTSTLGTVNNLAILYKNQGKIQEAEAMYQHALEGYEKAYGPEHTSTLDTVSNLGRLYSNQGKMHEAETMYRRALEGYEKAWGPEHTSTLGTVNNLATLYKNQGKIQEAEAMYQHALEGYEKAYGPEHTSTLDTVSNLGRLYSNQSKMHEAEAMYRRALEGYEKALGPEHTSTLGTVNNLATLYKNQGKIPETEAMYQRALEGYEKAYGPEHTSTLDTVSNLGRLYSNQGKMHEAETMYRRALEGYEKALGPEHTSTLGMVNNLAILYKNQGKMDETMYRVSALSTPLFLENASSYGGSTLLSSAKQMPTEHVIYCASNDSGSTIENNPRIFQLKELGSNSNEKVDIVQSMESIKNLELDESRSIASDDDDISSQTSSQKSSQRAIAERQLGALMAHNPELGIAYNEAMASMPGDRFVTNFRRLLKRYYLDIRPFASTSLERTAVELLRSRGARTRLAKIISNTRNANNEELHAQTEGQIRRVHQKDQIDMERWIASHTQDSNDAGASLLDQAGNNTTESDSSDSGSDENGDFAGKKGLERFPNIQQLENFLTGSTAFQALLHNFRIFALPRSLSQLALSIPSSQIRFSNENDVSLINKIKTFMEEHTGARWNWWPFSPRKKFMSPNQTRVYWQCFCGKHIWTEMSTSQMSIFQKLSQNGIAQPSRLPLCSKIQKTKGFLTSAAQWITNPNPTSSNTQQPNPLVTSTPPSAPSRPATAMLESGSRPSSPSPTSPNFIPNNPYAHHNRLWTLFGVHGGRKTLELGQICSNNSDNGFLRQLRETYRDLRGFWRVWFSFWQFSHCDFVKFEKIGTNRIISRCSDLPTGLDYEYSPRPPHADMPPITPHEFNLAFSSCGGKCYFAILHDCFELEDEEDFVSRIPRKKGKFEMENSCRRGPVRFAWGIQAQYAISFLHVVMYHSLIMVGPFLFWVWWQKHHPNDLQNASIPLTVATVLISLFWSATGILGRLREPQSD